MMPIDIYSGTLGMRLFVISCTLAWAEAVSIEQQILESTNLLNNVNSPTHPSREFTDYQQIYPKFQHARYSEMLQHTKQEDGSHLDDITMHFEYNGRPVIIDLSINGDLLPIGHFLKYQNPDGSDAVLSNYNRLNADLCHYQGQIRGNIESRVAISTCNGVHGMLMDGTNTFYIAPVKAADKIDHEHFMYSHSDLVLKRQSTSGDYKTTHKSDRNLTDNMQRHRLTKRSASWTHGKFDGPNNSNKDTLYVELMLVADKSLFEKHNSVENVHLYLKSLANMVNSIYVPLNIVVVLNGVEVWNEKNEIHINENSDITIEEFAKYKHRSYDSIDNAQLVVGIRFNPDNGTANGVDLLGKGYFDTMCDKTRSVGIATDYFSKLSTLAWTMTHEIGHNFGLKHDAGDCTKDPSIMAAELQMDGDAVVKLWSPCSMDWLSSTIRNGAYKCLRNKPITIYGSTCGNGLVEHGEQCDCGVPGTCTNPCCDPATCMLRSNASCASGTCCDLDTCRPRSAGFECRSTDRNECDLTEFCSGESEYCPDDFYRRDTEPCGGGMAFCYKGACHSQDDQCRLLYGPSATACGYDFVTHKTSLCANNDDLCGRLRCETSEKPRIFKENLVWSNQSIINGISYSMAKFSNSKEQHYDLGMTPNGVRCGKNAMCLNQTCRMLQSLWDESVGRKCAANCGGRGSCDNTGSCFCEVGFGGESCDEPGPGGSRNSGPASDDGSGFVRVMYVFFLGIVPFVALFLLSVYYWRFKRQSVQRKSVNGFQLHTIKSSPHRDGGGVGVPSTTDDTNYALLRGPQTSSSTSAPGTPEPSEILNNIFGRYKGFSLKPLPPHSSPSPKPAGDTSIAYVQPVAQAKVFYVPLRSAPPVPHRSLVAMSSATTAAAALTPPPRSTGPPLIPCPILGASNCSAEEYTSPLRHNMNISNMYPVRPAPAPPVHGIGLHSQARVWETSL